MPIGRVRCCHLFAALVLQTTTLLTVGSVSMADIEYLPNIEWNEPPIVLPGADNSSPSDAVVLFDGTDLAAWENGNNWIVKDGVAIVDNGDITTKQSFGDCQLHLEWSAPTELTGNGQDRGNSGIFLMDTYEIQVLDSYDNKTYFEGQAGAIYKQTPPMINAMRPPGEWNTYDIIWNRPHFNEDGGLKKPAYVTLLHNGIVVLNNFELLGDTPWHRPPEYNAHADKGPIRLQFHGAPVRYRNIWVREIEPLQGERVGPPLLHNHDTGEKTPIE